MSVASIGATLPRVRRRLRQDGLLGHLRGWWLGRKLQKAGLLVVHGGWPPPAVDNRGGRIEVENCAFFSGVRLECWAGATIRIGNATYLNRNPQSFGRLIGRWVVFRNFFEYTLHVVVAALAVSWFRYYLLLWWIVAYRYLDVGPRRLLQRLYNTAEKRAARPWAPTLNWAVIAALYVLSFLAVYHRQILFADVPGAEVAPHVPRRFEIGLVVGFNLALVLVTWVMTKRYTQSLLRQAAERQEVPELGEVGAH